MDIDPINTGRYIYFGFLLVIKHFNKLSVIVNSETILFFPSKQGTISRKVNGDIAKAMNHCYLFRTIRIECSTFFNR